MVLLVHAGQLQVSLVRVVEVPETEEALRRQVRGLGNRPDLPKEPRVACETAGGLRPRVVVEGRKGFRPRVACVSGGCAGADGPRVA